MKKYFYRTVYVHEDRKHTNNKAYYDNRFWQHNGESGDCDVNLIARELWSFAWFSTHALNFPRNWCKCECEETPEGTVFVYFTTLILLLCVIFFFHLWLQGCLNYGVITHTSRGDGVWLVRAWAEQTLLSSHSHTSSCHWSTFSLKQQFSHSAFIRPDLLERSFRLEPAGGTVPLFM